MLPSILIFIISGLALLIYMFNNQNRKIERYYYRYNLLCFALLEFCVFLLTAGLVLNMRYVISHFFKYIKALYIKA